MIGAKELASLEAAAISWHGTPFCENSAMKGAGVSCHQLVAELYFEAGILPRMPIPGGTPGWARSQNKSPMTEWIEASGHFDIVKKAEPGDLLGFRLGHVVHHLAIMLSAGRIIHSVMGHGAQIGICIPGQWVKRHEKTWRPKAAQGGDLARSIIEERRNHK